MSLTLTLFFGIAAVVGIIGVGAFLAIGMIVHDFAQSVELEVTAVKKRLFEFFPRPLHA